MDILSVVLSAQYTTGVSQKIFYCGRRPRLQL
jgi:hypothetical protein